MVDTMEVHRAPLLRKIADFEAELEVRMVKILDLQIALAESPQELQRRVFSMENRICAQRIRISELETDLSAEKKRIPAIIHQMGARIRDQNKVIRSLKGDQEVELEEKKEIKLDTSEQRNEYLFEKWDGLLRGLAE